MRIIWTFVSAGMVAVIAACSDTAEPTRPSTDLPTTALSDRVAILEDRWIVWLSDDVDDVARLAKELIGREGERVIAIWQHTIRGFLANLDPGRAATLREHPQVRSVRADIAFPALQSASWGLERVNQRALPLAGDHAPVLDGSGVDVYVVDTGIRSAHTAFGGRAVTTSGGFDAIRDTASMYYAEDCWEQGDPEMDPREEESLGGHGTHVAGTIGAHTYGIAPGVDRLISVRVLNCGGSIASLGGVISGIDWITATHDPEDLGVANLSLGGVAAADTLIESSEAAITASIQTTGIVYVVAAGNIDQYNPTGVACNISPARMADVITVASTDSSDTRASHSNHGSCVDIFAPGADIVSTLSYGPPDDTDCITCTDVSSGTSMAAPHVAGIAAHVLQAYGSLSPAAVRDTILAWATPGAVTNPGSGSPNLLAFTPRVVSSGIIGPDTIADTLTYEWAAERDGGDFENYSYEWSRRYHWPGSGPGPWSTIGVDSIVEPIILSGSPPFDLRLSVSSTLHADTTQMWVFVHCTEPCVEAPSPIGPSGSRRNR